MYFFRVIYSGKELFNIYPNEDEVYALNHVFICEHFEGTIDFNDGEVNQLKWFDINDLPDNIDDNYVIEYSLCNKNENVLITFGLSNGKKTIRSNGIVNVINNQSVISEVILIEYGIYILKILGNNDLLYIYTYPNFETNIYKISLNEVDKIKIGNSQECNCHRPSGRHARILSTRRSHFSTDVALWQKTSQSLSSHPGGCPPASRAQL